MTTFAIVTAPPPVPAAEDSIYAFNRAPLMENALTRLPAGSIVPRGWLAHQLELMARGMVGQMPNISHFLTEENGWLGGDQEGWEEQPYWFRGFYDLALITRDAELLETSSRWLEAIFASQQHDGYFGPPKLKNCTGRNRQVITDLWPHMVMIDALIHHHEATGDDRVILLLQKFFTYCRGLPDAQFIPEIDSDAFGEWKPSVQQQRAADMLPHLYWLYNRTGETWLLELATRFYRRLPPPDGEFLWSHVVTFAQRIAYPAIYAQQTHEAWQIEQSEYFYKLHMLAWGQQPRGIYGADEHIRHGCVDPRQGFETCAFGELAKSFYLLAAFTGQARYGDRVEDLLFNHFPASASPDFRGVHYLTASNLPVLDGDGGHAFANTYRQLSYSSTFYRCCVHNVSMTWPWFIEHLWMATADRGLAAFMYSASVVRARVADGVEVAIEQETDYPFRDQIKLTVRLNQSVEFPLYLRVPGWCDGFAAQVNGEQSPVAAAGNYLKIWRRWADGDMVRISMPMKVGVTRWPRNGAATIDYGPLSFSLKIDETWRPIGLWKDEWRPPEFIFAQWPEMEVRPGSAWNYGLCISNDDTSAFKVIEHGPIELQPWRPEAAPIEIAAPARRINGWRLEPETATVQELQAGPICSDEPIEWVSLIPLGCARLRMACLPVIDDKPHARVWVSPEFQGDRGKKGDSGVRPPS